MTRAEEIRAILEGLNSTERLALDNRLDGVLRHRRALSMFPTPGHLACFLDPNTVQTPLMDALDYILMSAHAGLHRRYIINTPPQEGKTVRCQVGGLWLLLQNQGRRIAYASYEEGIAARSGLQIRQWIEAHGGGYRGHKPDPDRQDVLSLTLDPSHGQQTSWKLAPNMGRRSPGGVISVGVGGALTGRAVDVMIVDDPLKNAEQAMSPVYRKKVINWFQSVVLTRLPPSAIVIVVQTRWDEEDLSGWLQQQEIDQGADRWKKLIVRAQAEDDDPLGRAPGEWLESTRDRSPQDWEEVRRQVGERWWAALYQQRPAPVEGGIFQRSWFQRDRVHFKPELVYSAVYVDPADNDGAGDEAGVVVAGIGADRDLYILEDLSGHFTVAQWVRLAIYAHIRYKCDAICYEQSLSRLRAHFRTEWKILRKQARLLHDNWQENPESNALVNPWPRQPVHAVIEQALDTLSGPEDSAEERRYLEKALTHLWPYVPQVLDMVSTGPLIKSIKAEGSKSYRAEMAAPLYENRRVHHVGSLEKLEHQMATWQPPSDSPDRMDAAVHALNQLDKIAVPVSRISAATGTQIQTRHLTPTISRSTGRR